MTAEELRRDNRFLMEQLREALSQNRQLREDLSEIKNDLKEANRRADEEAAGRKRLFEKLERFMDEQKAAADDRKRLERENETLKGRLAMANQVLYGGSKTCSEKYSGQKNEGINDGRDDFDWTEKSLPEGTPGPVGRDDIPSGGMTDDKASSMDDSMAARNDEYTNGIVNGMQKKLLDLIAKGEECFPDKVWRALNYFYNFWDRLFAYRHDGEYSFDNMAVERALRTTVQRKNGLFFCSPKGARNSGIYNTFISTCLQKCRSFRDFFVDYVREWNRGRRDYENLLPMTIGIK